MAKISVEGSEATIRIIETDREDGETQYELSCDKGAWCPKFSELINVKTINLGDAVAAAWVHADCVMHL